MPTPKLNRIIEDFMSRIPDRVVYSGNDLLGGDVITDPIVIENYINRAMQEMFGEYWQMAWAKAGEKASEQVKIFINLFPELAKYSSDIQLTTGNYLVITPYLDFFRIIGGVTTPDNYFIKVWDDTKYTILLSGEYDEYIATNKNPAIIQVNNLLAVFPQNINTNSKSTPPTQKIKLHYIKAPLNPTTGGYLTQNGTNDSPFYDHWNKEIADRAYKMYLEEANETL